MKYVLYRFPDVVKPELIAVEFGEDISAVASELMQDVIDELSGTAEYSRCKCKSSIPEEPNNLEYLSGDYDYEMRGIVEDLSKPFNTIIYFGVLEKEEPEVEVVPFYGSIRC